jgi:signal transduction histidine kinase
MVSSILEEQSGMSLIEMLGVFGVGFLMGKFLNPPKPQPDLEINARLATEMSQFKAGFLARTSHELRSPLNGLIGAHQLILTDLCDSPEEEREFIAQAHESALKLLEMLDEVINVSKAECGTSPFSFQPVSVLEALEEVYHLTHLMAANRSIDLKINYPGPDLYVMTDPRGLRQVLLNLVNGAIASMPDGFITLSVETASDDVYILLTDNRPAEAWSETLDLLNQEQTSDTFAPGFKLTLSQTLLELMKGKLELISATEANPKLRCILPKVDQNLD